MFESSLFCDILMLDKFPTILPAVALQMFPHPTQAKVKFPTPQEQKIVKCPRFAQEGRGGGGVGNVEVSI